MIRLKTVLVLPPMASLNTIPLNLDAKEILTRGLAYYLLRDMVGI